MIAGLYSFASKWTESGTLWCISDLHLGDAELRAVQPNRPSDEEIIRRINATIGRKDHLLILGDIGNPDLFKQIRGHKILVMGNHDANKTGWEELCDEVYSGALLVSEKVILCHEPIASSQWICFHGHVHGNKPFHYDNCYNFSCEAVDFTPINLNQLFKAGLGKVNTIHRKTIDKATEKKRKKGNKYNGK